MIGLLTVAIVAFGVSLITNAVVGWRLTRWAGANVRCVMQDYDGRWRAQMIDTGWHYAGSTMVAAVRNAREDRHRWVASDDHDRTTADGREATQYPTRGIGDVAMF